MLSLWSTLSPSSDMYPGGGVSVVGRGRGGSRVGLVTGECCSKVLILFVPVLPGLGNCVFSGTELLNSPPLPVDGNKDDWQSSVVAECRGTRIAGKAAITQNYTLLIFHTSLYQI